MDWGQLWEIVAEPDNVAVLLLVLLVTFYTWYGLRQARATDRHIAQLEADPELAARHHRRIHPYRPGWVKELPVWPYLLRVEFLAALAVMLLLMVWSLGINAPLGEPANPNRTMNPAKAPWYFVGLQEMLVYFDPWFAGVVLPLLIVAGLMAFPYLDAVRLGSGYYSIRQRLVPLAAFGWGFFLWLLLILIGTFFRGPGWMWFWPGQTWDHTRAVYEVNRNLPDALGIHNAWAGAALGVVLVAGFVAACAWCIHKAVTRPAFGRAIFERTSTLQYAVFQFFAIVVLAALPAKMVLRLLFRVKYVLVTPWFNL
jgi:hypothetical protein